MKTQNILVVDDDINAIQVLARILEGMGKVRFVTNGPDALRMVEQIAPDLILLDAEMPGMSGFEVCEKLKSDSRFAHVPVIFVTSHSEAAFELASLEIGAADFISKPVNPPLVQARVRTQLRLKELTDELTATARTDVLTGLPNRRAFDEVLEREWSRSNRSGEPLSVLMIDVDHFKVYNDHYGHPAGDACLAKTGAALALLALRPGDFVARYGGEEFVFVLPQTPRDGAEYMAQQILTTMRELMIPHAGSPLDRHVSVSVGVSFYDEESPCWVEPRANADSRQRVRAHLATELIRAADRALYAAKVAGRAQARVLDIADLDAPEMIRELSPRILERAREPRRSSRRFDPMTWSSI